MCQGVLCRSYGGHATAVMISLRYRSFAPTGLAIEEQTIDIDTYRGEIGFLIYKS